MNFINKYGKYIIILIIVIVIVIVKVLWYEEPVSEVSKEPILNKERSFDFLGECIDENPILMANLAEDEVKKLVKDEVVSTEGIKVNDSTFSVTVKTKKGIDSVITEKFTVILKFTSCKSYILIDIKR